MSKSIIIIILTLLFLQMELQLQLQWILFCMGIAAGGFMCLKALQVIGKKGKSAKDRMLKSLIECGASFCIGILIIPFTLEFLESKGWIISVPLIGIVSCFVMLFAYQIKPIFYMYLRTKGVKTETLEDDENGK